MEKCKDDIKERAYNLIKKNRVLNFCKFLQFFVPIILIAIWILYYFIKTGNYNFNMAVSRYEFYILLVILLIYSLAIENITKGVEKSVKSETDTLKNKMILKICNCKNSCNCKDELNSFMKKNGVKVI